MKIAVTADSHLRGRNEHPERYHALESVLGQVSSERIENLIVAGDLFDKDFQDYSEFEQLARKYIGVQLHIIPGNHDPSISEQSILGENIHIYDEPSVATMDGLRFVFLPYEDTVTMGEKLAPMSEVLKGKTWVLVGHGDYHAGTKEQNPLEPGIYMPLSSRDLQLLTPRVVFLGHIHKPGDSGIVHYPGSTCGLDISETGKRSFLVYDSADSQIIRRPISTDVLYFQERFLIVPMTDEVTRLEDEIERRIDAWQVDPADHGKVSVAVKVIGYSSNRSAILKTLEKGFAKFTYSGDEGPKIDSLLTSTDRQLEAIADRVVELVSALNWDFGGDEPDKDSVVVAALSAIYGD